VDAAALGGAVEAPADVGEQQKESAAAQAALASTRNISQAVAMELRALMNKIQQEMDMTEPARKRKHVDIEEPAETDCTQRTVSTVVRA